MTKTTTIIDESFKLTFYVMRIFGLYTPSNKTFLLNVRTYAMYFIFLVLISVLILTNMLLGKRSSETIVMNFTVVFFVEVVGFCLKFIPFFKKGRRIKKCIHFFGKTRFAPRNEAEKKITDECIGICQRNSRIFSYGILVTAIPWCCHNIVSQDGQLPVEIWVPYDPTSNYLTYYATLTYTIAAMLYASFAGSVIDPLIGGLAYQATCQLKILKYNLQHIDEHIEGASVNNKNKLSEIKLKQVTKHLQRCINHHNDILNFVAEYEECFSFSVFCQFAASLLALCFCCIGLVIVPIASIYGIAYILTFSSISFQIFFYCHYGTLLFEENNTLINAIYMGHWYRYDKAIRRILLIVMERSKRPMIVTAAKVINLTLQTYVSVLKSSYSLTAVMNNYN